jgi:magnesium transporter
MESTAESRSATPRRLRSVLSIPDGSPPPRIRLVEYDADSIEEHDIDDPEKLRPYAKTTRTTWIDIQGLGDEERLLSIASILGIHQVALADAVNIPQRAKAEDYIDHILLVVRAPLEPFRPSEGVPQVGILIAENYLVTFQERYFGFFDEVRSQVRDERSPHRSKGAAFLAYALADALVDRYYPVVEDIQEELDEVESTILDDPSPELVSRLHRLQRRVTTLRRVARPLVEALFQVSRSKNRLIPEDVQIYMKDVEDHAKQILGRLDAARDNATDTMGAVLATLGHRQNEVMKVLTLVGSIFIPLTFVAGIYGMNFEYMPELRSPWAYPAVILLMFGVAAGMVTLFRRKGWL